MELSFGEQIKILLKRKNMTIKDLADRYTEQTGVSMSRQNLTQRLHRDNFPEQDMRVIAALLGYNVSIELTPAAAPLSELVRTGMVALLASPAPSPAPAAEEKVVEPVPEKVPEAPVEEPVSEDRESITFQIPEAFRKNPPHREINPLTGEEYLTNTVRRHPEMEEFLQVYDQTTHEWSDVQEEYFWEFQEKKKQMMGADYQEPIII